MSDDQQPKPDLTPPPRTPNRGPARTPPVIEGEAVRVAPPPGETASASHDPDAKASTERASASAENTKSPATGKIDAPGAASTTGEEPAPAPSEPPPGKRGFGMGAVAASAIGGAALAAVAVYAVEKMNAPPTAPAAAFEKRIAEIERAVASAAQTPQASPAALAALEKRVASVEALANGASETARKAAEAAVRAAGSTPAVSAPAAPAPGAGAAQALQAIETRIAALEKGAASARPSEALETRLAAVEKTLAAPKTNERATETRVEPAPPPDLDPLRRQIAALEARLADVEKQAAPLAESARATEARIREMTAAIQPLASRIDETRTQGEAERKRAETLAERSSDAARLSLAQSIVAAIQAGAPFATQVEALGGLGAPAERLAPLKDAARTGVATQAELARALAALEPKIMARADAPADASVVDRLTNSALGLVRVRPAGEAKGDGPADVFARMTQAAQRGDIAATLKERERLPEAAKAASAEWAKRAQQRLETEQAARALLSDSMQKFGRS